MTAPDMVAVHCSGASRGECDQVLMDAPTSWGLYTVQPITARTKASGQGIVKRCPACRRWVDITFAERARVA